MSEWRHFVRICRKSPKSDIFVLVLTFVLTVVFDLVVAIAVGIVLATVLFMKRMSDVTEIRAWSGDVTATDGRQKPIPAHTAVYEIGGPLFFANADKLAKIAVEDGLRAIIVRMSGVPAMDATASKSLEVLARICQKRGVTLILSHVNEQPMKVVKKSGLYEMLGEEAFARNIDAALEMAERLGE